MFRGASKISLDAKGRMAVPTRYRERIAERCDGQLVITVDREQCLLMYPLPAWEEIERKLIALPTLNAQVRRLQGLMMGYATEVDMDGNGRVLLSQELREFAGLDRKVMMIGQGNKFEIWDEARWHERCQHWVDADAAADSLPAELEALSF